MRLPALLGILLLAAAPVRGEGPPADRPPVEKGTFRFTPLDDQSDVPERYPNLRFVSVESGIGWIPFVLDALDYQCGETAPEHLAHLSMKPSEYFRRQFYGCFWFESRTLKPSIDHLGVDLVLGSEVERSASITFGGSDACGDRHRHSGRDPGCTGVAN